MENQSPPPWSALEISKMASKGDLKEAYLALSDVYLFFIKRGLEATGEYKALHMAMLVGEIRSRIPAPHTPS